MAMAGRGYDLDTKRRSTAKGSSTGLVPVCPTKVEACKSILFAHNNPHFCHSGFTV